MQRPDDKLCLQLNYFRNNVFSAFGIMDILYNDNLDSVLWGLIPFCKPEIDELLPCLKRSLETLDAILPHRGTQIDTSLGLTRDTLKLSWSASVIFFYKDLLLFII